MRYYFHPCEINIFWIVLRTRFLGMKPGVGAFVFSEMPGDHVSNHTPTKRECWRKLTYLGSILIYHRQNGLTVPEGKNLCSK
jgi:hypothetical protein